MASLQKGGPPSADFFLSNCNTNNNRGKLTHASSRHWSPASRPSGVGSGPGHQQPPFTFSAVHSSKASTMDGDKRRLFLDRMKANPLFKRTKPSPPLTGNNKSTGVEILTDDEVCIVSKVLNQEWNHIFIL